MTEKLLKRIENENKNVYLHIESLKRWYKSSEREVIQAEAKGYLYGLKQLGFISEREKQLLFCYVTL